VKAQTRMVFVARDGSEFQTEAQCRSYERETAGDALVGLTKAQVEAARSWADPELADAFETFGYQLRRARQAAEREAGNGEQNGGDETAPPLADNAELGAVADSSQRTDRERTGADHA
jgi:hypothetical protein